MTAAVFAFLSLFVASAQQPNDGFLREADMTLEREAFETVELAPQVTIQDDGTPADIVLFDNGSNAPAPSTVLNITSIDLSQTDAGWKATYTFDGPLPKEPTFPINVDLFLDSDGKASNNAKTGVFRAGTDLAFLLLFGTRTKWHTLTWQYNPSTGRWGQLMTPVTFEIGETTVSMNIPYSLLAKETVEGATVRGFALTSTGGVTAVDVAPGMGIPGEIAKEVLSDTDSAMDVDLRYIVLGVFGLLLLISLTLWYRSRK